MWQALLFFTSSLVSGPDFKWVLPLGTGHTGAPQCVLSSPGPPTLLDGAAKITVVGNLGLIALLKICETSVKRTKKLMVSFFSEHLNKKGAYFYLYKATNSTGRKEMKLPSFWYQISLYCNRIGWEWSRWVEFVSHIFLVFFFFFEGSAAPVKLPP